jgi:hypothetical protein
MYSMCLQRYAHPYDFHLKTIQWSIFAPQDWSMYTIKNNKLIQGSNSLKFVSNICKPFGFDKLSFGV